MRRWESAPACGTSTYLLDSIERNKSIEGAKDNFVENVQLFVSHKTDPVNYNLNHGLLNLEQISYWCMVLLRDESLFG